VESPGDKKAALVVFSPSERMLQRSSPKKLARC
jgi:hypothetical protein